MASKIDNVLITVILVGFVILGGTMIISDFNTNYDLGIEDGDFRPVISTAETSLNLTMNTTQAMKDALEPGEISWDTAIDLIFGSAVTTLFLIWSFIYVPSAMIISSANFLGLPPLIIDTATALLSISILFGLIYLIFNREPR